MTHDDSIQRNNCLYATNLYDASWFIKEPTVKLSDVIGLDDVKEILKEHVTLPGVEGRRENMLIHGLPGTGKTMLVHAIANEVSARAKYFWVHTSDCISKLYSDLDRSVARIFEMASENKPCVVFIDEIDLLMSDDPNSMSSKRRREFLQELSRMQDPDVIIMTATSKPWLLDEELLSQFGRKVYVRLLSETERFEMIKNLLKDSQHELSDHDLYEFAKLTEGYTASDMIVVIRDASMYSVRKIANTTHFKKVQNADGEFQYVSCMPEDENAFKSTISEIDDVNKIRIDPIKKDDVMNALSKHRVDNSPCLEKHFKFLK